MRVTADMVKATINDPVNRLDTIVAEHERSNEKCGYVAGTPAQLCQFIDHMEANALEPYRVRLFNADAIRKGGNKSKQETPFVFTLPGRSGVFNMGAPQTAPQTINAAPSPVPLDLAKDAAGNAVRNEFLADEVKRLRAEIEAMREELEEAEEDAEEAEATLNAAPPPPPQPWWNTEAGGKAIIDTFAPIGKAAAQFVAAKLNGGKPPVEAKPEQLRDAGDTLTDEERRAIVAFRNAKAANDSEVNGFVQTFLDNFAAVPEKVPSGNGVS